MVQTKAACRASRLAAIFVYKAATAAVALILAMSRSTGRWTATPTLCSMSVCAAAAMSTRFLVGLLGHVSHQLPHVRNSLGQLLSQVCVRLHLQEIGHVLKQLLMGYLHDVRLRQPEGP